MEPGVGCPRRICHVTWGPQVGPKLAISTVLCTPCRLQKEKQDAEAAREESAGKAAADLEALRAEAAAAEQRLQAAQVRFISS